MITFFQQYGSLLGEKKKRASGGPVPGSGSLPGPAPADLQFQGKAQEGADDHQQGQDPQVLEGRAHRHRTDDIGGDEELQPQQDGLAEIAAKAAITIFKGPLLDEPEEELDGGDTIAPNRIMATARASMPPATQRMAWWNPANPLAMEIIGGHLYD